MVHDFQNAPNRNLPLYVEIKQQKRAQYLTHFLFPVLTLAHRTWLLSASSVLAVRISCGVMVLFVFRKALFIK
jgi:hypothetical protein